MASLRAATEESFAESIMIPYDKLLTNGHVLQAEVTEVRANDVVLGGRDAPLRFHHLVLATGSSYAFPGKIAQVSKTAAAERYSELQKMVQRVKRIAIVGGGAVGCELAGELAADFPGEKEVHLVHSHDTLLAPNASEKFKAQTQSTLDRLGVKLHLGQRAVLNDQELESSKLVYFEQSELKTDKQTLEIDAVFVCVGPAINNRSLQEHFSEQLGTEGQEKGRLTVDPNSFQVAGHENVYAIGDCSSLQSRKAWWAMKQGAHLASVIQARQAGTPIPTYKIPSKDFFLLSIGRNEGVVQMGSKTLGSTVAKPLKSKGLFVKQWWKTMNQMDAYKQRGAKTTAAGQGENLDAEAEKLSVAMQVSKQEARKLLQQGVGEVEHAAEATFT